MNINISVIICTHNPRKDYLDKVLKALNNQTLSKQKWELIIIDNASDRDVSKEVDISWHQHANLIIEEMIGLTYARITGIKNAQSEILVFVDDDNLLNQDYLQNVIEIFNENPNLGAIGGKSIPKFEVEPESWFYETGINLGCRDLGDIKQTIYNNGRIDEYPDFAPIGSGLVIKKKVANIYLNKVKDNKESILLGRKGKSLISGEDNDIILYILNSGWGVGYFPNLVLSHLIPPSRLEKKYLANLNHDSTFSWIKVLDIHGIRPWPKISKWMVLPRKIKAFFKFKPWRDPASYINWSGACGKFEGQADLK